MKPRLAAVAAATLLSSAVLAGCGSADGSAASSDRVQVVTSFYPLQFAVQQIGGKHVDVTVLTRPGVEPHDFEPSPKDIGKVSDAKLFVYQKGISGAVDQAAKNQAKDAAYDVSPAANLNLKVPAPINGEVHGSEEHEHEDEGHSHDESGATDPHYWVDPVRYRAVATAIAGELAKVDPAHKADYEAGAKAFGGKLTTLAGEYTTGLKSCTNKDLVTGHAAFGYLADRTGLTQIPIAGVSPGVEPAPGQLSAISSFAKKHSITTIYTETLASPEFAQTIAKETGAKTAVLDPIEGVTDKSAGKDYFEISRSNLATLKKGQGCQ